MPASNSAMIHKLQQAINDQYGARILYNKTQFYSEQQERPITLYILKQALLTPRSSRNRYVELFSSTSQIQIVLYLRDYWYLLNGWEIPTDNAEWNEIKQNRHIQIGQPLKTTKKKGGAKGGRKKAIED